MTVGQLIQKYERKAQRCAQKEDRLSKSKDNLSKHGYWSLGYAGGRADLYKDVIDDLREILMQIGGTEDARDII